MGMLVGMIWTHDEFLVEDFAGNLLHAAHVIRVRAADTDGKRLRSLVGSANAAVVTRTAEETGMLVVEDEVWTLPGAGEVEEAPAVVLRALDDGLGNQVTIAVGVERAATAEGVDVGFDVVVAQPLLVKAEETFAALSQHVSLLSLLVADHALVRVGDTRLALPLGGDLAQTHAQRVELATAAAAAGEQEESLLPVFAHKTDRADAGSRLGLRRRGKRLL